MHKSTSKMLKIFKFQVKLGILNEDDEIQDTFLFRYHDAPNMPDFMVSSGFATSPVID